MALLTIRHAAVSECAATGLKCAVSTTEAPGATLRPDDPMVNSGFAQVKEAIFNVSLPVFEIVKTTSACCPTRTEPKLMDFGFSERVYVDTG
jgi:hypothetical protein